MASSSFVTLFDTAEGPDDGTDAGRRILGSVILSAPSKLLVSVLAEKLTDAQLEELDNATKGRREDAAKAKKKTAQKAKKAVAQGLSSLAMPNEEDFVRKKQQPEQPVQLAASAAMKSFDSLPDKVALKIVKMAAFRGTGSYDHDDLDLLYDHDFLVDVLCKASEIWVKVAYQFYIV